MNIDYRFITSDQALEQCCIEAAQAEFIALDTEFMRIRSYYPKLGLIQLYDGQRLSLIDPLTITAWQPFCDLLINENVTKLLHASSEDLEVFQHEFGVHPSPFIDTQVLASFCGYPLSCGYATLITDKLQVRLDKSETRTDWLARPLSDKQAVYAAADVYYLLPLAKILIEEIKRLGWFDAALDECRQMIEKRAVQIAEAEAYFDINHAWQLNARQLAALRELAGWRLSYARKKDMALNFVVREEHLWKVAQTLPDSLYKLEQLNLSSQEVRIHGKTMLDLVAKAKQLPSEQLPAQIIRLVDHLNYKKAFKALKEELQLLAEQHKISPELLASRKQINQVLKWHWKEQQPLEQPALLSGWRDRITHAVLLSILSDF